MSTPRTSTLALTSTPRSPKTLYAPRAPAAVDRPTIGRGFDVSSAADFPAYLLVDLRRLEDKRHEDVRRQKGVPLRLGVAGGTVARPTSSGVLYSSWGGAAAAVPQRSAPTARYASCTRPRSPWVQIHDRAFRL